MATKRSDRAGMWATIGDAASAGWGQAVRVVFIITVPSAVILGTATLLGTSPLVPGFQSLLRSIF
jgi:hypothetical protein